MVQRLTIDGISIEEIPQDEVRYSFEKIEPHLKKIIKKSYSDWIPSDVYLSLRDEESDLYMFYDEDIYIGFIITQFIKNRSGEGTLFIWASYQKPEYNYRDIGFTFVDKLAEQLNAVAIEFASSRQGWKTEAPKAGYELISYTFRKEL
tara:strand:- start:6334 stop:6777 length:444 start_codon:yes stop_codon:yes gene_type:complete